MVNIYFKPCVKPPGRVYKLIAQGLHHHPSVNLVPSPEECNYIFYMYWAYEPHIRFDPHKLVHIDFRDPLHPFLPQQCVAYFKRSWVDCRKVNSYFIKVPKKWPPHFHPISYCIMDEFAYPQKVSKDIDIGCYLRPNQTNRVNILLLLLQWATEKGIQARLGPVNDKSRNVFDQDYLQTLARTKILVTCNPDRWEGDSRTWEGFANKCLIFVDELYALKYHPLKNEEHCIFYRLGDERGLLDKLNYFIKNEKEASQIAYNGYKFTMAYHRTVNRIDEILSVLGAKT
jgi:hypothetical protein